MLLFYGHFVSAKTDNSYLNHIWSPYFQSYSVDDGLSQSHVDKIIQDDDEFLWLLTPAGIDRFDGFEFESILFQTTANTIETTESNAQLDIIALFLNHQRQVSVITGYGSYYVFDPVGFHFVASYVPTQNQHLTQAQIMRNGQVFLFGNQGVDVLNLTATPVFKEPVNHKKLVLLNNIEHVSLDNEQILWLSTMDEQLYSFKQAKQKGSSQLVKHQFALKNASIKDYRNPLLTTAYKKQGVMVAFLSGELFHATHLNINAKPLAQLKNLPEQPKLITSLLQTSEDYFWIGTRDQGLYRISVSSFEAKNYQRKNNQPGSLMSNYIDSLFLDRQGQLWVSSSNGVSFAIINNKRFYQIGGNFAYPPQLFSPFVNPILLGPDRTLWVGSLDVGLSLLTPAHNSSHSEVQTELTQPIFIDRHRAQPAFISRLGIDDKERIWVGSHPQLQWFDAISHEEIPLDKKWLEAKLMGVSAMKINSKEKLIIDYKNKLTFQSNNDRLFQFQLPVDSPISNVSVISNPIDQTYWLASSRNNQIFQFNANNKTVTSFKLFTPNGRPVNGVVSLLVMANKTLWIGTKGEGIIRKNLVTGNEDWLTVNDGLPDNMIYSMLKDARDHIWISSNKGLSRYTIGSHVIQNFTVKDGLQSNEFNGKSVFRSNQGILYFGGINGITVVDENSFFLNQHIPKTYIHSVSLITNNGLKRLESAQGELRSLDYLSNSLSFKIGAIDLLNPEGIRYSYRLLGQSEQWQELGSNRIINLLQVPAGDYTFEIRACNHENSCNLAAKTIRFSILPAPWLSALAFSLYLLLTSFMIIYFFKRQKEKLRIQKALADNEKRISQELRELSVLKDQFLANISHELRTPLNGIIGLSEILQINPQKISEIESQESLMAIKQCGIQLNLLVSDLLDFSQFHNKQINLNRTVFAVYPLFDQIVQILQPSLTNKLLVMEIDIYNPNLRTYADKNRIRQVLYNLINNAIKFSDRGVIKICAKKINQNIEISVTDQGIGIESKKYDKIFMSFSQIDGSSSRNQGGIGLGLSICKEIIELHGVELTLKSQVGTGSTFSFLLPDRTK